MSEDKLTIKCCHHTKGFATFLCKHLEKEPVQVWFSNPPIEEDKWPEAWCASCEALFVEAGEWSDANFKQRMVAICHHCYEELRAKETAARQ